VTESDSNEEPVNAEIARGEEKRIKASGETGQPLGGKEASPTLLKEQEL